MVYIEILLIPVIPIHVDNYTNIDIIYICLDIKVAKPKKVI